MQGCTLGAAPARQLIVLTLCLQGPGELLQRLTSGSEEPLQQRRLLQVQQSSPVLCNAKCQSQVCPCWGRLGRCVAARSGLAVAPVLHASKDAQSARSLMQPPLPQVKLYEAFILCAMLLSSLFTGLICMHVLGVPDRFEKPKDAGSRQD